MTDTRPLLFVKSLGGLRPADDAARAWFDGVPEGDILRLQKPVKPRSLRQLRLWWALCEIGFRAQQHKRVFRSPEDLHFALKCALRPDQVHVIRRRGKPDLVIPPSIAFDQMPQEEFGPLLDDAIQLFLRDIVPGVDEPTLRAEIEAVIEGGRAA